MAKKLLLIVNPVAGVKKSNKYLTEIIDIFCQKDYECTVQTTSVETGPEKIVSKMGKNKDLIVCIGGDGTFNEMVSGIINNDIKAKIGYIPSGSTNDFAGGMGLSLKPLQAAHSIADGETIQIDVGKFNDRIFTYVASFGIFTKTSYNTPRDLKNSLGYLAYVLEGAKELTDMQHFRLKIETEKKTVVDDYIFGAVCNSKRIGGGFLKFSDDKVDINDGMFEVFLIKNPNTPAELVQLLLDLQAADYSSNMFEFFSARTIKITTKDDIDWTIDGEFQKGSNEISIENIHSAISFIVSDK